MKSSEILSEILKHMEWADYLVWRSVLENPSAGKDEKLKEILLHYHTVQIIYLRIWNKEPIELPSKSELSTAEKLLKNVIRYYSELREFSKKNNKIRENEEIVVPWIKTVNKMLGRTAESVNLTESILHVSIHSSHHRGQVNKRLRELGSVPETIDFVAWAWLGKPPADWNNFTVG